MANFDIKFDKPTNLMPAHLWIKQCLYPLKFVPSLFIYQTERYFKGRNEITFFENKKYFDFCRLLTKFNNTIFRHEQFDFTKMLRA